MPLEQLFQAAADDLLQKLRADGYTILPLMAPKEQGATVNTHVGPCLLDNQFYVAFNLGSDTMRRRVQDIANEYFVPAVSALARFAERIADGRLKNSLPFSARRANSTVTGRYPAGHPTEIKVRTRPTQVPLCVGDCVLIRNARYCVVQAANYDDGQNQRILLDRPIERPFGTNIVVHYLTVPGQTRPSDATIVLAPVGGIMAPLGARREETGAPLALTWQMDYNGARDHTTIVMNLNGGVIVNARP
jgi:hypothetical protein